MKTGTDSKRQAGQPAKSTGPGVTGSAGSRQGAEGQAGSGGLRTRIAILGALTTVATGAGAALTGGVAQPPTPLTL